MLEWIDDSPFDTQEKCFNALAFFARTLERELAKAQADNARLHKAMGELLQAIHQHEPANEHLRKALERILQRAIDEETEDHAWWYYETARNALEGKT